VRERRPLYVDLLPPCNNACPAGENIQAWLSHAQAGRYREAWLTLVKDNPLPAVHGRVRYHPCESSCNRQHVDSAVSIHAVERFVGDLAAREGWRSTPDRPASASSSLAPARAAFLLPITSHAPAMQWRSARPARSPAE
jgi:NADPH-dependent glutamate synthase beta subunit-like oxidoreductase